MNSLFSGKGSDCQKSLAEFAASAANKIKIIFCRGVYLAENTAFSLEKAVFCFNTRIEMKKSPCYNVFTVIKMEEL